MPNPHFGDVRDEFPVKGIEKVTPAFVEKVKEIAARVHVEPLNLLAVMSFESGLNPKAVNKDSGATGLIQFLKSTAEGLGTTTAKLTEMTAEEQLPFVEKFFAGSKAKLKEHHTLEDTYMAVLFPSAIGKGPDHVLFRKPTKRYEQNSVLDVNKDGTVTVREAAAKVRARILA
jgi:hypothetical protein